MTEQNVPMPNLDLTKKRTRVPKELTPDQVWDLVEKLPLEHQVKFLKFLGDEVTKKKLDLQAQIELINGTVK